MWSQGMFNTTRTSQDICRRAGEHKSVVTRILQTRISSFFFFPSHASKSTNIYLSVASIRSSKKGNSPFDAWKIKRVILESAVKKVIIVSPGPAFLFPYLMLQRHQRSFVHRVLLREVEHSISLHHPLSLLLLALNTAFILRTGCPGQHSLETVARYFWRSA